MPLSPGLAKWLAQQGHDAVHASQAGLGQATDTVILEHARNNGLVVITADLDYPRLLALAQAEGPGLILFRGGNYSEKDAVARMRRMLDLVRNEELTTSVVVIEKSRIRRIRLPFKPEF